MAHDGGGAVDPQRGGVLSISEYTVDIDELWATAHQVLGLGDAVESMSRRQSMARAGGYGGLVEGPADRWALRFGHLVGEVGRQIERAGYTLKGSADAYYEVELTVRDRLRELGSRGRSTL